MVSSFGNVFSTTLLNSLLGDNIDNAIRLQVKKYPSRNQKVDHSGLLRYAQALKNRHRTVRRQYNMVAKSGNDEPKRRITEMDYSPTPEVTAHDIYTVQSTVHLVQKEPTQPSASSSSSWMSTMALSTTTV